MGVPVSSTRRPFYGPGSESRGCDIIWPGTSRDLAHATLQTTLDWVSKQQSYMYQTRKLSGRSGRFVHWAVVPLSVITARHVEDLLSRRSVWSEANNYPGPITQPRPCLHQLQVLQHTVPWVRDPHDPETGSGRLLLELGAYSGYRY